MSPKGKDIILEILFSNLDRAKYNLDKTHIYARCPFCGDSRTDRNATSFNIKIPDDEIPRWLYICFRSSCRESGYVTPEFLRMINSDNYEANVYLNKVNKLSKKERRFREKGKRSIQNFPSPKDKLSIAKLNYINKRLGIHLDFSDLMNLKIHTNMIQLLKYNEVQIPTKKYSYYRKLSMYGIAFISSFNDYLIVRNTSKTNQMKRYTVVDIFEDDEPDKFKFYFIPTKIDIMSVQPIVINMSEGGFDILSVYFNLDIDDDYDNHIYVSVSGSSYEKALVQIIRQYGLVDIIVNIFSDDNIELGYYKKLHKKISRYTNTLEMKVYYNQNKSDFGHPKSDILLTENFINSFY